MEFWNEAVTNASWEKLKELNKEIRFVLIGGWATYLYTKLNKSKDIDIVVDYDGLDTLKKAYDLRKNDILRKYEIKLPMFDIGIYLPYYSKLAVPLQDVLESLNVSVEGFLLPRIDVLITLKMAAFLSRKDSIKGKKDEIDILGLVLNEGFDPAELKDTLIKYGHEDYIEVVIKLLNTRDKDILDYLKMNQHTFSRKSKNILEKLKKK